MGNNQSYRLFLCIACCILFAASFLFFLLEYRYYMVYHEQQQLFQFNRFYFLHLLSLPGGIATYTSDFIVQFFYYPWVGAFILSLLLLAFYFLVRSIFVRLGANNVFLVLPFLPVMGMWALLCNYQFEIAYFVALLIFVCSITLYIRIPSPRVRYVSGCVSIILLYLIVAGLSSLVAISYLLYELLYARKKGWLYVCILYALIGSCFPYLASKTIYLISLGKAYALGFPYQVPFCPAWLVTAVYLFVPFLFLLIRVLPAWLSVTGGYRKWLVIVGNTTILSGIGIWSIQNIDQRISMMLQMDFEVQNENWEEVLEISARYPSSNHLITYYTNIALYKTGMLPYRYFNYRQIGPESLFLEGQKAYLVMIAGSEVYYQLGYTNEATRLIFESIVANDRDENPRLLKRLVQTSLINEDYQIAEKYLDILKQSLCYRKWADEHLQLLENKAQLASLPWVKEKRSQYIKTDFFAHQQEPANLPIFMEQHPENKMAFEYLMMFYLLTKNTKEFMKHIAHIADFDYQGIPTLFEEAILVYLNTIDAGKEAYNQYPIRKETFQRFKSYVEELKNNNSVGGAQYLKQAMALNFKNTYWYYYHFYDLTKSK